MTTPLPDGIELRGAPTPSHDVVLTADALAFVAGLHRSFDATRRALLATRQERQARIDAGELPDFLPETRSVRDGDWRVAPAPPDLDDRRVEITGPVDRKMVVNALNSGARVFMADFEDATSPTWENLVEGQRNLMDAIRRRIDFTSLEGKAYALNDRVAALVVRPRGWHLDEAHVVVDGEPMAGSLFDFGLYFFHNARELLDRGSGPYFYLPKLESHREARLWNGVFLHAQDALGVPRGSIRATVLVETLLAAFEMDEILYELREHAAGLNAGRWDYIFSLIKKLRAHQDTPLPDRAQITMTVPFMRAYTELLVRTCHRRGAHAMGGMAAFIPSRRDAAVNAAALERVQADKERESRDGFDGTWVAHPDLVPVAQAAFDARLGDRANQKDRVRDDVVADARALLDVRVPDGLLTRQGVRANVDVALQYLDAWLQGTGAVAIYNLMEDAATAEISRSQLWQWIRLGATTVEGDRVTADHYRAVRDAEVARLRERAGEGSRLDDAARLLDALVLTDEFTEFLTIPAYAELERASP